MYKHLQERYAPRPPVNVSTLVRMKAEGEKIACITAYDASFATLVDDAGIDLVLVGDSLGIAAELEAAMALHIDNYEDEWAATLADPERLRRFRSFVNAPEAADPSIAKVSERGQRRPATAEERATGPVLVAGPTIPVREG